MSSLDILSMCLRNLFKRKLRTSLTVLGVMIGTASIVIMVSLGLAVNARFAEEMDNMTDVTIITVYDYNYYSRSRGGAMSVMVSSDGSSGGKQAETAQLDDNMIQQFQNMPGVVVATPFANVNLYLKSGRYMMDCWNVVGLKPEAMPLLGYTAAEGSLLTSGGEYDVVFGAFTEKNFAEPENYWNNMRLYDAMSGTETPTLVDIFKDKITMSYDSNYVWGFQNSDQEYDFDDENAPKPIKPVDLNVVGLLADKNGDYSINTGLFMDIETVKKLQKDSNRSQQSNQQEWGYFSAVQNQNNSGYQQAYVKCADLNLTKQICEDIRAMGFDAWFPGEWLETMQEMARMLQLLLAAIGSVSLFVAAIGIANTMIMSIYERTREIGVMKVLGAAIRDIKWLFLLESGLIGLFGGVFGLLLSLLVSYLLNHLDLNFMGMATGMLGGGSSGVSLITPWLCGVALAFSSGVGLVSGYFPARRAMRLSAITAIRTE